MLDGRVAEIRSYAQLMAAEGALAKLVQEHVSDPHVVTEGNADKINTAEDIEIKQEKVEDERAAHDEAVVPGKEAKKASTALEGALTMKEERETGAVVSKDPHPRS